MTDLANTPPFVALYRNWRGEVAERRIVPIRIYWGSTDWHPEPQWLLTGFDLDKQAERDFALADFNPPAETGAADGADFASLRDALALVQRGLSVAKLGLARDGVQHAKIKQLEGLVAAALAKPAPDGEAATDPLWESTFQLSPDERFRLATALAGSIGYDLTPEAPHPDAPPAGDLMAPAAAAREGA